MFSQSGLPANEVDRRAFLGPRFGEEQGAIGKIESGLAVLAGDLRAFWFPVKPSGDHEMNDEKEFVFQREDDTLAETSKPQNSLSFGGADWRIEGTQNKRATDACGALSIG